jgi:hypothetical protein
MKSHNDPSYVKGGYHKHGILSLRASSQWRHWLHLRAAELQITQSQMVDMMAEEYARKHDKPMPPRRWPPET